MINLSIENILFLDIETVPEQASFDSLDERMQHLWTHKASFLDGGGEKTAAELYHRAGIYAEFGKVICICAGHFAQGRLRVKAYAGLDEHRLLAEFADVLHAWGRPDRHSREHYLCAHNGKEFDFPYLARRMTVQGISLPSLLAHHGKKPWEVTHLDTMELWKFGDRKNFTSLDLLTAILGIPSPKADISGADVGRVFWEENGLDRIVEYCRQDVIAVTRIFQRFSGGFPVPQEVIDFF